MKVRLVTLFLGTLLLGGVSLAQEPQKLTSEEQLDVLTSVLKVQQAQAEVKVLNDTLTAKVEDLRKKYNCEDCIVDGLEGTLMPRPEPSPAPAKE